MQIILTDIAVYGTICFNYFNFWLICPKGPGVRRGRGKGRATCYSVIVTRRKLILVALVGSLGAIVMGVYSVFLNQLKVSVPLHCLVHLVEFLIALAFSIPLVKFLSQNKSRFHAALAYASFVVVLIAIVAVRMQLQNHFQSKVFDTLPYAAFAPFMLLVFSLQPEPRPTPPPPPPGAVN